MLAIADQAASKKNYDMQIPQYSVFNSDILSSINTKKQDHILVRWCKRLYTKIFPTWSLVPNVELTSHRGAICF